MKLRSIFLVGIASVLAYGQARTGVFSLPLDIERSWIQSSLLISVKYQNIGQSLSALAANANLRGDIQVLVRGLSAIRDKNYARAATVIDLAGFNKEVGGSGVAVQVSPEQLVDIFNSALGGLRQADVLVQLDMGDHSLFIVDPHAGTKHRATGFVVDSVGDQRKVRLLTSKYPLENLLVERYTRWLVNPASLAERQPAGMASYRVPSAGSPVTLHFSGQAANVDVFSEADNTQLMPVLRFYRQAMLAFKAKNFDQYFRAHSTLSAEKLRKALEPGARTEVFHAVTSQSRFVKFVMDLDPVYLIFFSPDAGDKWRSSSLDYEYVLRVSGGEYRIVNKFFSSIQDELWRNPKLFDFEVLKKLAGANQ